jgi:TPR repeat protein
VEAPAAAAVPSTPANNGPTPAEVAAYIARAHAKIRQGDIASARRLLERASSGDEAEAWLVLAETYDPRMLARWGVLGIKPDLEKSKAFYQEAQRRGAQGARERLLTLSVVGSPE